MSKFKCAYTEIVDIHKLQVNPKNPNNHPEKQINMLSKVIDYQGQRSPIVVSNRSGFIVKGHGRLSALLELGWDKAAIDYQDYESEAMEYADLIADNKIAELAEHDDLIMNDAIKDLGLGDDFDMDLFGIEDFELIESEVFDEEKQDDVPELKHHPITKRGDVWLLGNHRLMCGDSTLIDDVEKLLSGQSPNTMITDPPYGVEYKAGWRAKAKGVKPTERENTSSIENDNRSDWYDAYCLHKGNIAYVWHASAFTDVVMDGLKRADFEIKAQIIWNKNVHALSRSDYQWKHEPCWYAVKKGAKHSWEGDRKQKTVWDVQNVMFERDGGGKTSHPTQKPIELYQISILNHTNSGEYIYEPFAGSGSSIIAAEKNNRRSLSMELDDKFCDVIINRWQGFTGKKATLESNGKYYNELVDG